jgi:hypothetical protein
MRKRLTNEPWTPPKSESKEDQGEVFDALPQRALFHLLHDLRVKVQNSAWPVLRSAYREVLDTPWLERSLMLTRSGKDQEGVVSGLVEFMRLGVEKGEAVVKDGPGVRVWVLRRPA